MVCISSIHTVQNLKWSSSTCISGSKQSEHIFIKKFLFSVRKKWGLCWNSSFPLQKLRKWPHHTCYTPKGFTATPRMCHLWKFHGIEQRETEFWLFSQASTAEDADICKDLLGGKMTHSTEIKDIRVFILNGKETHILVASSASEIRD